MRSNLGYRVAQFILGVTRSIITVFVVVGMAISMGARADDSAVAASPTQAGGVPAWTDQSK